MANGWRLVADAHWSAAAQQSDGVGRDRLASADGVDPFVRLAFDTHPRGIEAEGGGERRAHRVHMIANFRRLENHRDVDVPDHEALFSRELNRAPEQVEAIGVLPTGIGVSKMATDVAQSGGA